MATIPDILNDAWEGNRYGDVRSGLQAKLREMVESIRSTSGKLPSEMSLDVTDGGVLKVTFTLADGSTIADELSVGDILGGKVAELNVRTGYLDYRLLPHQVLISMGRGIDGKSVSLNVADSFFYDPSDKRIKYIKGDFSREPVGNPSRGMVYYNLVNGNFYRWAFDADLGEDTMVPIGVNREEMMYELRQGFVTVDKSDTLGLMSGGHALVLPLESMGQELDGVDGGYRPYEPAAGDYFYDPDKDTSVIWHEGTPNSTVIVPNQRTLYLNRRTGRWYRWDGSAFIEESRPAEKERVVMLSSMGSELNGAAGGGIEYFSQEGDLAYDPSRQEIRRYKNGGRYNTSAPLEGVLYCNAMTELLYRWDGSEMVPVAEKSLYALWRKHQLLHGISPISIDTWLDRLAIDSYSKSEVDRRLEDLSGGGNTPAVTPDGTYIIDSHESDSVVMAPSARQVKLLFDNLVKLYNSLSNLAFADGRPVLDFAGEVRKYRLDVSGLVGMYVHSPQSLEFAEGSTAEIVLAAESGYLLSAETDVRLTDSSGAALLPTEGPSYDPATGRITLKVSPVVQDMSLSGEASSGAHSVYLANQGTCHMTLLPTNVAAGADYTGKLTADAHYKLSEGCVTRVVGAVSGAEVPFTVDRISTLLIEGVTEDLVVYAEATAIPKRGMYVTGASHMKITDASGKEYPIGASGKISDVWDGDSIELRLAPVHGYRLEVSDVLMEGFGGQTTLVNNQDGSYSVRVSIVTGDIRISCSEEALAIHTITLPTDSNVLIEPIDQGGGVSGKQSVQLRVYDGDQWSCRIRAAEGYRLEDVQVRKEVVDGMSVSYTNITASAYNANAGTIVIPLVDANINIGARAAEVGQADEVSFTVRSYKSRLVHDDMPADTTVIPLGSDYGGTVEVEEVVEFNIANVLPSRGVRVMVGGVEVPGAYDASTRRIALADIDGAVEIDIHAESPYWRKRLISESSKSQWTADANHCINRGYILIPDDANFIEWAPGARWNENENFRWGTSVKGMNGFSQQAGSEVVKQADGPVTRFAYTGKKGRYFRAGFTADDLDNCWVKAYQLLDAGADDPLSAGNIVQEWLLFDGRYSDESIDE